MNDPQPKVFNVLFLCTSNSARSIMAEGLLNSIGKGRFQAFSAGSNPRGTVSPHALSVLLESQVPIAGLRSKSWNEFSNAAAPKMDFVLTVCDDAAGEICPAWPGQPLTAHWGVREPSMSGGTAAEIAHRFREVAIVLRRRIELFVSLPIEKLDRISLQQHVTDIASPTR
jgi:arsenate reductase (thioredoxin)